MVRSPHPGAHPPPNAAKRGGIADRWGSTLSGARQDIEDVDEVLSKLNMEIRSLKGDAKASVASPAALLQKHPPAALLHCAELTHVLLLPGSITPPEVQDRYRRVQGNSAISPAQGTLPSSLCTLSSHLLHSSLLRPTSSHD